MASLIQFENVTLRFGAQAVLRDLTLGFERGQTTVVLGESGCGKSTLLKLIIGLLSPSSGRVLVDGRDLRQLGTDDLNQTRRRFGFVFQGAALFDSLSVFENVAFPLREHTSRSEPDIRGEVRQRLEEVGLSMEIEAKFPAELSGGMRKRVGLARALVLNPAIILYDEPTTGLDPVMGDVINGLIRELHQRRGVTSIVVTHDLTTVQRVADRAVMLCPLGRLEPHEPQVIFDGTANQLAHAVDARVRAFVSHH